MSLATWYQHNLMPTYTASSLDDIDWHSLTAQGIKLALIDLDNTLAAHGATKPSSYAKQSIRAMQDAGLITVILSNAKGSRSKAFATELGIDCLGQANKPSGKKIRQYLAKHQVTANECLIIGDQLLTDIWAANRAGTKSLLVRPLYQMEALNVRLKRLIEQWLIKRYGINATHL